MTKIMTTDVRWHNNTIINRVKKKKSLHVGVESNFSARWSIINTCK